MSSRRTYTVNLQHKTCTCGRFQERAIPCKHAVAVSTRRHQRPIDSINRDIYSSSRWHDCYGSEGCDMPPLLIDEMDLEPVNHPIEPELRRQRGRPPIKRKQKGDVRRRGILDDNGELHLEEDNRQRCTVCRQVGHNAIQHRHPQNED